MKEIKRKCLACNKLFNREDLIKITKLSDNTIKINPSSKEIGRSVYVCKNSDCIKNFLKKKRIRNLKCENQNEILKTEEKLKQFLSFTSFENI